MDVLKSIDSLVIREKKEYTGVPSTWKVRPEFCLSDSSEKECFYLFSEKGTAQGFPALQESKSLTLYMTNTKGEEILYFEKKSGVLGIKMEVYGSKENFLGAIQKKAHSIRHTYEVQNPAGQTVYLIEGPAMIPEVFTITKQEVKVGRMSRKMTKQFEEGVSRHDHFNLIFPMGIDSQDKGVLLGGLILIDLSH